MFVRDGKKSESVESSKKSTQFSVVFSRSQLRGLMTRSPGVARCAQRTRVFEEWVMSSRLVIESFCYMVGEEVEKDFTQRGIPLLIATR